MYVALQILLFAVPLFGTEGMLGPECTSSRDPRIVTCLGALKRYV